MSDRSILEGVIIAQEAIHSVQNNKEPSMMIKLNIKKDYDKVDWRFLCKSMEAFGFSNQYINIIFNCIASPKISLPINGTPEGYFDISKGLRKGDPLSPFLFIFMAKAFGRAINIAHSQGKIRGIKITKGIDNVTHQ